MTFIVIFIFGAIGGLLRCCMVDAGFAGTLVINGVGSLALGIWVGIQSHREIEPWLKSGMSAGLLGAFTTFSSFVLDVEHLFVSHPYMAVMYAVFSLAAGTLLCMGGEQLMKRYYAFQRNSMTNPTMIKRTPD